MKIKNYSVSLEEEVVEKAKAIMYPTGSKLSPILNNMLRNWVEEQNIKTDIQTTSSISDFSLGQGSSGFNDTATGVSIVNANADSRIVSKVKYIENEALIPLGYAWLSYQAQFMKSKDLF